MTLFVDYIDFKSKKFQKMASKLHIDELPSTYFTWEKYESNYGDRLNLDFRSSIDDKVMAREIKRRCIGWCDGRKLTVRSKSDMVAIMLEDDDFEKFWFHYPKIAFEIILDGVY